MTSEIKKLHHDKNAPYWATALVIFCATGLATSWIDLGSFWKGYVLDMTGPAWNYILVRGLFSSYRDNAWRRFFTPGKTITLMLIVAFGIEGIQYLNLYEATFDPWDLLAYVSILIPVFIIDFTQTNKIS